MVVRVGTATRAALEGDVYVRSYLKWTVSLDQVRSDNVTVYYRFPAGTYEPGRGKNGDLPQATYQAYVTIPAGQLSADIEYRITADTRDEKDEAVVLELHKVVGDSFEGGALSLMSTAWILDDDGSTNDAAIFSSNPYVVEGDNGTTVMRYTVSLSEPQSSSVNVSYELTPESATAGSDFITKSGTLTFAPGVTERYVDVTVKGDTLVEQSERVLLNLTSSQIDRVSDGVGTILDDDAGFPTISVRNVPHVGERDNYDRGMIVWEVQLDRPAVDNMTIPVRIIEGTAETGKNSDAYTYQSNVRFQKGESLAVVFVSANADTKDEHDEVLTLQLLNPGQARFAGDVPVLNAPGWVWDDDGSSDNMAVHVTDPVVVEGDVGTTKMRFDVLLSRPAPNDFSINYATKAISADASDFVPQTGKVSFKAGATIASVTVDIKTDKISEGVETIGLDLGPVPGVDGAYVDEGIGTIMDDDGSSEGPTVSIINTPRVVEGDGYNQSALYWNVQLSEPATQDVIITYNVLTATGEAQSKGAPDVSGYFGTDFQYRIPAGSVSGVIRALIASDNTDEKDEAVILELSNVRGASFGGGQSSIRAVGWVLDDDGSNDDRAIIGVSRVVDEGDSGTTRAYVDVSMSREAESKVTVKATPHSGSATLGSDVQVSSKTLVFEAGQTNQAVAFDILGDKRSEAVESFSLDLSTASPEVHQLTDAEVTILDDDAAKPVMSVVSHEGVVEGDPFVGPELMWTINLDRPSTDQIKVAYRILPGMTTLGRGQDLPDMDSFFYIRPGRTTYTVKVPVTPDTLYETDEAAVLEIHSAPGTAFAGGVPVLRSTGWIKDDDGSSNDRGIFVSNPVVREDNDGAATEAVFEVSLSQPSDRAIQVQYRTVDGTARAGQDYTAKSGTLTFQAGQTTAFVKVPVAKDAVIEATEKFSLAVTPATTGQIFSGPKGLIGTAEILNTTKPIELAVALGTAGTSGPAVDYVTLTITRSGNLDSSVKVNLASNGGDALSGIPSSVTLAAGQTSKTLKLAVDSSQIERGDTFDVSITGTSPTAELRSSSDTLNLGTLWTGQNATGGRSSYSGPALNYGLEGGASGIVADLNLGKVTDTTGARDTVSGVKSLLGSRHGDTIYGADGRMELSGGAGNDLIQAEVTAGQDVFSGQVYRLYGATLGRRPDPAGLAGWSELLASGQKDLLSVIEGFTASNEFTQKYGATSDTQFIQLLYKNVLGRSPASSEVKAWLDFIEANGSSRAEVVRGFSESPENQFKTAGEASGAMTAGRAADFGDDVFRLYQATLGRAPDAAGHAGWSKVLAEGRPYLETILGFVNSKEFTKTYGDASDREFVTLLYENVLGRAPDASGLAGWLDVIEGGGTRAEVVRGFAQSAEFIRESTPAYTAWLRAQGVDDRLDGGSGNNVLIGGAGADVFVINGSKGGTQTIGDMAAEDWVELFQSGYDTAAEAVSALRQTGEDVTLRVGNATVVFELTNVSDLTEDSFIMV